MAKNDKDVSTVTVESITEAILMLRGQKVMLDASLASLYGVETKALKRAVTRNKERFPEDFMFQLTKQELINLRCHFDTSSWGGTRYLPFAFTQEGVAMLSSVLRSQRAVKVNIEIMRAFVRFRELILSNRELAQKLDELDSRVSKHDAAIADIIQAIRQLMAPRDTKPKRPIGFAPWKDD